MKSKNKKKRVSRPTSRAKPTGRRKPKSSAKSESIPDFVLLSDRNELKRGHYRLAYAPEKFVCALHFKELDKPISVILRKNDRLATFQIHLFKDYLGKIKSEVSTQEFSIEDVNRFVKSLRMAIIELYDRSISTLSRSTPRDEARLAQKLGLEPTEIQRPTTFDEVGEILSSTIRKDDPSKKIIFCGDLLAQTDDDQINIAFLAESSTGKSYIPIEIAAYFPKDEVMMIAGASPTAFYHEAGIWDEERRSFIVDLERKIVIFLDQPHFLLLERLRPLLSHDRKELHYKITDRSERSGLRTKNVIVKGFSTFEFCTSKLNPDEQEKTRTILLSPSVEEDKIKEALQLIAWRKGQRKEFSKWLSEHPKRIWLIMRIEAIRNTSIRDVFIENPDKVYQRYIDEHRYLKPRDMRDFPRIMALIKAHALLNCFHRERIDDCRIKANDEDIEAGFNLYNKISQANERGLSPYVWNIYEKVILPLVRANPAGVDRKQVGQLFYHVFHKPLSNEALRKELLPSLESAGLILQELDPLDKRRMLIFSPPTEPNVIVCSQEEVQPESEHTPYPPVPPPISQPQGTPTSDQNRGEHEGVKYSLKISKPVGPIAAWLELPENADITFEHLEEGGFCMICGRPNANWKVSYWEAWIQKSVIVCVPCKSNFELQAIQPSQPQYEELRAQVGSEDQKEPGERKD